ncbi:MAG: AAA family ATPase [bacterium]
MSVSRAADIKTHVSVEDVLRHYGSTPDAHGRWVCLFPERHNNGDMHHSLTIRNARATCWSQGCVNNSDIFTLVGLKENLHEFSDQRRRLLELAGLSDDSARRQIVRTHSWEDGAGVVAYHQRWEPGEPKFTWTCDPEARRRGKPKDAAFTVYQLPLVTNAQHIAICEGERDADTMQAWFTELGMTPDWAATCTPNGAGDVKAEFLQPLYGKAMVVLTGDNDDAGRGYVAKCGAQLVGKVDDLRRVTVPDAFKDWAEWAAAGHTARDFARLIGAPAYWNQPSAAEKIPADDGPVLIRMDTVRQEAVQWLWPGRIARRKFGLLVGLPGLGKSYLACDVAARHSRGMSWPDGLPAPHGASILLSAEDGLADTIGPRLSTLGADLTAIHVLTGIRERGTERLFDLSRDLAQLDQALNETRAQLVVVDPLSAYLGSIDSYKDADVRSVLAPLAALADAHAVAVLGIIHLTKQEQRRLLYRAAGSIAFVAAARTVLAIGADPEDEGRRLLFAIKSNLTALPPALAFRITPQGLTWEPGPVADVDPEEIFGYAPPPSAEERDTQAHAAEFLHELLRHGPRLAEQVFKEGERHGFTRPQLQRARKAAQVHTRKLSFEGGWEWTLDTTKNTKPSPHMQSSLPSQSSATNPAEKPKSTEEHVGASSSAPAQDDEDNAEAEDNEQRNLRALFGDSNDLRPKITPKVTVMVKEKGEAEDVIDCSAAEALDEGDFDVDRDC